MQDSQLGPNGVPSIESFHCTGVEGIGVINVACTRAVWVN